MSRITITQNNITTSIDADAGENLLRALARNGFSVPAACGGNGSCGKCRVKLAFGGSEESVLACRSEVPAEDAFIEIEDRNADLSWNETAALAEHFEKRTGLGAAADLGTTTIAVKLFDLETGEPLGSKSAWNLQQSCGADVISRIDYCMKNRDGLEFLSNTARNQLKDMILELCKEKGRSFEDLKEVFLAGNTVMQHIFAGIDPESLAKAPFTVPCYFENGAPSDFFGAEIYYSPCAAAYVGGDITAGLLGSGVYKKDGTNLFIDIGTNGEMAIGGKDGFISCAVASGPAFEAAGIECGMPAADGAVNAVRITGENLEFDVLGGCEAKGICGSGLLDIAACLVKLGIIDESGYLEEDENRDQKFYLTDKVYISQKDVRQLQLAKAAVAAGIRILMSESGAEYSDVTAFYLAGGFGNRLKPESAAAIGMIPKELVSKAASAGNTGLAGAESALLVPSLRSELIRIKNNCKYIELSSDSRFNDLYVEEMSFPEE